MINPEDQKRLSRMLKWFERNGGEAGRPQYQSPRRKRATGTGSGGSGGGMANGDFHCCTCENSELHVSVTGIGITVEQVLNKMWPVKSGTGLLQKIKLTSDDDPAVTTEIELPLIECGEIDCQQLDKTGEFVGTREIGYVSFGNSTSCTLQCAPPATSIHYQDEAFDSLPSSPWTASLANSSVAANVFTLTHGPDTLSGDFSPTLPNQSFGVDTTFRSLAATVHFQIANLTVLSFNAAGSWSFAGGGGLAGAFIPGADIRLQVVNNRLLIDGTDVTGLDSLDDVYCNSDPTFSISTTNPSFVDPSVGTDVAEFDSLEVGWS